MTIRQDEESGKAAPGAPFRYTARLADELERRWQAWWDEQGTNREPNPGDEDFDPSKPKFFGLDMFPYPSGAGLHVGHPLSYTAQDIFCRYKRMRGFNVLRATGWDAFGLPAEQYAVQTGVHPAITTRKAIDSYRATLKRFGFAYDWSREFGTIDDDYVRWTQWIFLQIYDAWFDSRVNRGRPVSTLVEECEQGRIGVDPDGEPVFLDGAPPAGVRLWSDLDEDARREFVDGQRLAYVDEPTVNWCPKLGTALSNEEVLDGFSERGHHPVVRKPLPQWLFRITKYADRLIDGLRDIDWPESTKIMQTEWIGRSEGAEIDFPIEGRDEALRVYTTRPDTVFGATYMVVAPEHPIVDGLLDADPALRAYVEAARNRSDMERQESKEKTGVPADVSCTNPATGESIPIWVADYVLMGYGHGAIMAVPAHDERDHEFALAFGLPIVEVVAAPEGEEVEGCFSGYGTGINSANAEVSINGLPSAEAIRKITEWFQEKGIGRAKVNYKLRDWIFSRQRYWGEPFPIVWDERGRHHAISEKKLPLTLPDMADFKPVESEDPQPMLAKSHDWIETTAGEAGAADLPPDAPLRREANTMPGWAGSCWYFLRYTDPHNQERFASREAEGYWMNGSGVDLYIGGAEHAVLHLLYARFWHQVLYDLGHVSSPEPFQKMFHQGMISSFAYQRANKSLVPTDEVEEVAEGKYVEKATGEEVKQIVAKMSKSLRNVIRADDVFHDYGADTFRLYEMYLGPLEDSKPWNTKDTPGMFRFLQRIWRLAVDERSGALRLFEDPADPGLERKLHKTIARVQADVEALDFNTAIAAMIEFVNAAGTAQGALTRDQLDRFARILSPFVPHVAEELWHRLGHETSVSRADWPAYDEAMLREDEIEIAVQILGKLRSRVRVPADADRDALERAALEDERISELLAGKTVRKVIVVPGRLVNIVAN
jgi:leucyl-tRNA synthetase